MMAYRIQQIRPASVAGAMWPYPTKQKKSINVFFSAWLLDLREPDENSDYWLVDTARDREQ